MNTNINDDNNNDNDDGNDPDNDCDNDHNDNGGEQRTGGCRGQILDWMPQSLKYNKA